VPLHEKEMPRNQQHCFVNYTGISIFFVIYKLFKIDMQPRSSGQSHWGWSKKKRKTPLEGSRAGCADPIAHPI